MKFWKILLVALCSTAGISAASAVESDQVPINSDTFPDPAFSDWVEQQDADEDGFLSESERDAVTNMDLRKQGIQDLTGLEWFQSLEKLNCSENDLVELEIIDFPALQSLTCNENPRLETLTLSDVPELEHLYCFHSNLSELDLHDVPNLTYLAWGGSPLEELDLSENPNLHTLHVLGGNLTHADLSHNENLDTLLWNHTLIETLDLSHQTNLTYLNCTDNQLTSLDLSNNPKLETIYAGKNKLLAIRIPDGIEPFCDLTEQRPAAFDLPAGENGFLLSDLVPWMDTDQVSQLNGAVLEGNRIQLDSPNQAITYRYTDGAAELDAAVTVTGENDWQVPLHIDSWTYGEPAAQPQAQPAFGTAAFFYAASPEGPFQPEVPIHAGTWYVQAIVEETPQYAGLESVASFEIYPARPEYLAPNMKSATYGDYLADVSLESQFFWENGSLRVGNVGEQTHLAFYVPSDLIDYQMVEHIPVVVNVSPYDGTRLPIPQVSSRAEAESIVIKHGDWILQPGTDYTTALVSQENNALFTIEFQGNYTGTVTQTFPDSITSGGSGSTNTGNSSNSNTGSSGSNASTTFVISAQATSGGTISPDGKIQVKRGAPPQFTMRAQEGYRLRTILIDGKSIGAQETYRFDPVSKNHTISAEFVPVSTLPTSDQTGVSDVLDTQTHGAYVSGYPGNQFGPEDALTRAQAAQLFYSLLKNQDISTTTHFTDGPSDAWYAKAVNTLASMGIISGVGDDKFLPNQPITRAEFVTMATKFAQPSLRQELDFPDVTPDDWFYENVMCAADYGWISGYPDGTFGPNLLVTRAQATVILNRILGRSADRDFIAHHAELKTFSDVPASHWAYYDICEAANAHTYEHISHMELWEALL